MALVSEVIVNDHASATLGKIEGALDRVTVAEVKTTRAADTAGRQFEALKRAADPVYGTLAKLAEVQTKVQRAVDLGARSQAEANIVSAQAQRQADLTIQRLGGMGVATNDNVRAMNAGTASAGQMRASLVNLGQQAQDVAVSLQGGQAPLTVLMQQGTQIATIFAATPGGVSGVLGAAARGIAGLVTPTVLAVGGLAAVAGGFVFLVARAASSSQAIREFNVLLEGMNVQSLASAQGLEVAAKGLRDVGLTAAEARKQITDVTRAGLNPAVAPQIVRAGANLGAYLGGDQSQALTQALAGGVETATKYAVSVGAMTGAQAAFRAEMARTVPGANVLDEVLQRISQHADQMYQKSLTPLGRAVHDARLAFAGLFDTLSQSSAIVSFVKDIATMATSISDAVKGLDRLFTMQPPDWARKILNVVNGTPVDRATATVPGSDNTQTGLNFFRNQGLTEQQAAGVVGRLFAESNMNPAAVNPTSGAFGIAQWLGGREKPLAGSTDLMQQLELVWKEFQTTEIVAYKKIVESRTAGEAAIAMERFERAGNPAFTQKAAGIAEQIAAGGRPGGAAGGGVAAEGTSITEQAISQAQQMTAARQAEAAATAGQGLEQEKLQIALQVSRERQKGLLSEQELATMQAGLLAAANTRLTNEIKNLNTTTLQEIDGARSISEAYEQNARQGKLQEAIIRGQTEALQKFGTTSTDAAQQFAKSREDQIIKQERYNETLRNAQDMLAGRDTQAQLQAQISLTGQLPEIAQRELTILQAKQTISRDFPFLTEQEKNNRLAMVQHTADLNVKLAETQRAQQQIDSLFSSIGNTISSAIGSVIDGIFDKKKVIDWGATLKSALSSIVSQVAQSMLIRPLTGELLGALGASANVVNQFGSFGGSGASGSSGGISTGTLLQGGGLLKDLFGIKLGGEGGIFGNLFGGGSSGGLGFLDRIGQSLGFATPLQGPTTVAGQTLGAGSLFGSTTFGGALGGIGLGAGAGGLVSSLLGGDSMFGSLGGGALGLAGTLIGGPIGGILGGALGGLFGLIGGNKKPSNASAGANFDLSSFALTAGFAGGDPKIDQATQQLAQGVQQFLALLKTTGGSLSGNVLLQNGVNTGITVDSSLPEYSGRFNLGKDPTAALNTIQLALARSLTGITDTMQTVLDKTGDPAELAQNIAFANSYDTLSDAAADAFKAVEQGKNELGPYAIAMQQVTTTFQGLTDQANRFGLSLAPLIDGLAEATRRLQTDFTGALDVAFNEATGAGFINQLQDVYDQTIKAMQESIAVGLGSDQATQDLISQIYGAQLNSILGGLDQTQLDQVVAQFTGLNDTIVLLAQNTAVATDSTQALADAQQEAAQLAAQTAQAMQQIQDYLNQLNATPSAFVSPESALNASAEQYSQKMFAAQSGNADALSSITQYADQYIKNIEAYYASSEYGQRLVENIEQELQALIGVQGTTEDPAVVTNQLLTDLTDTVTAGTDQTSLTITAGTQQLIDANNAAAASTIAQNIADTTTLVDVTNATAAANIAMNQEAAASLIASNDNSTASLLAQGDASSQALIAANDNATAGIIADAGAQTAAILAGASTDATAIGLVTQNVGDQLSQVTTTIGNSQITMLNNGFTTLVQAGLQFANTQVAATFEAANSLINVGATYSNAQASATYGAASSIVQSDAIYSNNQLTGISTASATNDNLLSTANSWLNNLYQLTEYQGTTAIRQRQEMVNLLTQVRDSLWLGAAA